LRGGGIKNSKKGWGSLFVILVRKVDFGEGTLGRPCETSLGEGLSKKISISSLKKLS